METDINVLELKRMFVGELPWTFTIEVIFRTAVMYVYTLVLVRLLGKRGMGQLAPVELVIIIALGSAVGDPMFYADVPLLHGFAVITTIVVLHRGLAVAMSRSERVDRAVESGPVCVVQRGALMLDSLRRERVPADELFAALRESGFENLGEVRVAYLEDSGEVSAFRARGADAPQYGLSLHPGDRNPAGGPPYACRHCGELEHNDHSADCPRCKLAEPWVGALAVEPRSPEAGIPARRRASELA